MNTNFDSILDESLEGSASGKEPVPKDLTSQEVKELQGLLATAQQVKGDLQKAAPSPQFVAWLEARLLQRAQEPGEADRLRTRMALWPRAVLASLTLVLVLGAGSVWAAQGSGPGEVLYPLKRSSEQVALWVIRDPRGRANLHLIFADRRLGEVERLKENQDELQALILQEVTEDTDQAWTLISQLPPENRRDFILRFVQDRERHQEFLRKIHDRLPPRAQQAVLRALESARRDHDRALRALQELGPPSDPPNNNKP